MTGRGYATVAPRELQWTNVEGPHLPLTTRLGCSHTTVDAYRTRPGEPVALRAGRERLVVPTDGEGTLAANGGHSLEPDSLALVPAGGEATLRGDGATTWLVVSADADPPPAAEPTVVDARRLSFEVPSTSDVATARLTDRLGARGMKVNVRRLEPGDAVPYHTEGNQEELFVPLDGDGAMRVDGETHRVSRGSVTRVAPTVPRSAVNPGERTTLWLMVGAPPTGAADEWAPGAEILDWPGEG